MAGLLPGQVTRESARLLPEFGEAGMEADPAVARARLFGQVLTLLERLAEAGPVALIIEDAEGRPADALDVVTAAVDGAAQRLGVSSRGEAAAEACRLRLFDPAPPPRHNPAAEQGTG